jgi:D-glycero-D-manno-heptose 1,7-bisphosphate phosphatase
MSAGLFLDRDGVINVDHGYVHTPDNFEFLPGVFETVRLARAQDFAVIIVTNQAGIARGYYDEAQFAALTTWMCARFAEAQASITDVYHCPYHPDGKPPYNIADHPERKPSPGMLLRAARDHALDLTTCAIIGDQPSDMEAGRRAGLVHLARFGTVADDKPDAVHVRDHLAAQAWLTQLRNSAR